MKICVLSIDGGGVRGIIPAIILEYIENRIIEITKNPKVRLSDFLDFTAGTSSGSIISSMIIIPDEHGKPTYKMGDITQTYFNLAEVIFKKNFWRDFKTVWGLFGPRYSSTNINNKLLKKLNHWKLKDLLLPCAFTGYDTVKRCPIIYTNKDNNKKYGDYFVKDIVRGSMTIPSIFKPTYFRDGTDINTLINGSIFANNPAMIAYIEVTKTKKLLNKHKKITPVNVLFLSFGTGISKLTKYPYQKIKKWGKIKWFSPILDILFQSTSEITNYQMQKFFGLYNSQDNFIRINPPIVRGSSSTQNASKENMKHLHQDALNYITANKIMLNNLAEELVKQDNRYATILF